MPPVQQMRFSTAMMNRLPAIGFQTAVLNQDLFLLVIAAGSLALWFRRPVQETLSEPHPDRGFAPSFPAYALAAASGAALR